MLDRQEVRELEGKPHMMLDDQPVGLVEAAQVLELPRPRPARTGRLPVVVASDRSHRFGVVVDKFLGERDLRVAPLDPRLGKVPNLNSSSVLENGWPVLIIDVEDLIRSIDNLLTGRRVKQAGRAEAAAARKARAARSGCWSWTTRSPSASWSGSCWRTGATRSTSRSTASTAGTRCAPAVTTWSSATSTCPGWTASSSCRHIKQDPRLQADPGGHRLVQGPRGGPDPRPRRRRQLLPHQEQLPRPDVPRHRRRPDRRGGGTAT